MNMPPATLRKTVDVHSNDEIGYLAASLNYMANELNTLEDDQKKLCLQRLA